MCCGDVVRSVAENEHAVRVEPKPQNLAGALDRLPGELTTIGRVGAVTAEGEEAVQVGTSQLDVRRGLDRSGRNPQEVAGFGQPREQLVDAGEDPVTGRTRHL